MVQKFEQAIDLWLEPEAEALTAAMVTETLMQSLQHMIVSHAVAKEICYSVVEEIL